MHFNVSVRGIEELRRLLAKYSSEVAMIAKEAVAKYLVGNESHGLKHEPQYKHITREKGFPDAGYIAKDGHLVKGWHSPEQHRYVMAKIREGAITPGTENRSHNLSNGWKAEPMQKYWKISNDVPYGKYVQGDWQTHMHSLIGWRKYMKVINDNMKGAIRAAQAAVNKYFRERK